jgi:prepilin-type processing-associated H-X9-DG protein
LAIKCLWHFANKNPANFPSAAASFFMMSPTAISRASVLPTERLKTKKNAFTKCSASTAKPPSQPRKLKSQREEIVGPLERPLGFNRVSDRSRETLVKSSGFLGDESQIPLRHNGTANIIFVDGHVETIRRLGDLKKRILTTPTRHPQK